MPVCYHIGIITVLAIFFERNMPNWATSGATGYTDWYSNTSSGYRNTANIY